jgi:carboxymethylenebutenolidase
MVEPNHNRYLAVPPSGKGAGVLVLHAWWGLTGFMRDFCDRLAQEGFVALAPDMFASKVARTIEEAEELLSQVGEGKDIPAILLSALDELGSHPAVSGKGLAVVGFSFGAYWALWLAQEKPEPMRGVTLFYGSNGGGGDFTSSRAAFLGHFAEKDPYEPVEGIVELEKNLRGANRPTTFFTYPGTGHWFFEKDRQDAYDEQAASLAWERTLALLRES